MQPSHQVRREVLPLPGSYDVDGPAKCKEEISSAGMTCTAPQKHHISWFRHRMQDCLLKKLAINKHWEGWTDTEKREPFKSDGGCKLRARLNAVCFNFSSQIHLSLFPVLKVI